MNQRGDKVCLGKFEIGQRRPRVWLYEVPQGYKAFVAVELPTGDRLRTKLTNI